MSAESDPHDGETCAEVEAVLDELVDDLNKIGVLLARQGCNPRNPDGSWDYGRAIAELIIKARA